MSFHNVNPTDSHFTDNRFILWFGAYGTTYLMVYAEHLQDALDESIDWIVEHAPGLLADEQVSEAFNEAKAEGKTDEEAWEESQTDMTSGGNCGNFLPSWEWGLVAENPSRAMILDLRGLDR